MSVSVVIPAFNEEDNICTTLQTLQECEWVDQIIGVNDGSLDRTGENMQAYCDLHVSFQENRGKAAALCEGWKRAEGDWIVTLDADLRESARLAGRFIQPLTYEKADLIVAHIPPRKKKGCSLLKKRVQRLIKKETGMWFASPLSGQRAFRREHVPLFQHLYDTGFGIETMMLLQAAHHQLRMMEIEVPFIHRETGKTPAGFWHRGKQWMEVERCLWKYGKEVYRLSSSS